MYETRTKYSPGFIFSIKYLPSASVAAPKFVPSIITLAPISGDLLMESCTTPVRIAPVTLPNMVKEKMISNFNMNCKFYN